MSAWTVDLGTPRATTAQIEVSPPGEGQTSYYLAPGAFGGDWTGYGALVFEKKSSGGTYYDPDSYGARGDIVVQSGAASARFDIPQDHSGAWRPYRIPLDGPGWTLTGAPNLRAILANVTGLRIRAEYGAGSDHSALRGVRLESGRPAPAPPVAQAPYGSRASDTATWTVDFGRYQATAAQIDAAPAGDGKTSYYLAPGAFGGDWTGYGALVFEKKSWGGSYYGPDSYAAYGDVVVQSGAASARFDIPQDHSGEWRSYRVPLDGPGWTLSGAGSLAAVLSNVTGLKIRAEYGAGTDYSALRSVKLLP